MTAPQHDVVYVDLIKDEPPSLEEYAQRWWPSLPGVNAAREDVQAAYRENLQQFQPWRWHSTSEGNHQVLGQGERYYNEADAEHNIRLQFAGDTIVYLRRPGAGNEMLRMAYPNDLGEQILIGPDCYVSADGSVLNWRGINYVPAQDVR